MINLSFLRPSLRFCSPRVAFLFCCCCANIGIAQAQLNIKAGYSPAGFNPAYTNSVIKAYNESNRADLVKAMPRLLFMNVVELGLRYQMEDFGLEATYFLKFNPLRATLQPVGQATKSTQSLNFSDNAFSLGATAATPIEWLWAGATLDWATVKINSRLSTETTTKTLVNSSQLTSHLFLEFQLGGSSLIRASLRPYIQIPWTATEMKALGNALAPNQNLGSARERLINIGIGLVFCNGTDPRENN